MHDNYANKELNEDDEAVRDDQETTQHPEVESGFFYLIWFVYYIVIVACLVYVIYIHIDSIARSHIL